MASDLTIYDRFILEHFLSNFNSDLINHINENERTYILSILTRVEEKICNHKDLFGNFEFPYTEKNFQKPYLDIYILELLNKYCLTQISQWGENNFGLILSHDVDLVNKNHIYQDLRGAKKYFFKGKGIEKLNSFKYFTLTFFNILKRIIKGKDSLWDYHKWVNIETKFGFSSTYFFFVRPLFNDLHVFDCDFTFKDKFKYNNQFISTKEYIKILEQNDCEIGLHGSYNAALSNELISNQFNELQQYSSNISKSYRNHYLHFDITKTPLELSKTKINIDSTLGFNRNIGFRAGTCFPFYIYNDQMVKPILEIPQIIMDSALFLSNSLELNLDLAKIKVKKIIDQVQNVKGILTLNFHPDKISKPYYFDIYEYILEECAKRNAKCLNFSHFDLKSSTPKE